MGGGTLVLAWCQVTEVVEVEEERDSLERFLFFKVLLASPLVAVVVVVVVAVGRLPTLATAPVGSSGLDGGCRVFPPAAVPRRPYRGSEGPSVPCSSSSEEESSV